jgi:hypothetical protein
VNAVLAPPPARATRREPALRPASIPPPPRLLVWFSGAVVLAGIAMAVIGALRTGSSWDEPYHVMRLRNYFDHGWFALDWAVQGDGPSSPETNTAVYAPVTMLLLHGLGALVGVEGWGTVSTSPAAYDVRHLGIVLIGLAGTAAAASITRILLGSWRWALVTAAALLALPMWTGHLMFNVKDVPVATGYTLVTLALIAMVAPVRGRRIARVAGLAAGIVLMVGTRPAMWTAVVIGLVVLSAGVLAAGRFGNGRTALPEAAGGVLVGTGALVLIYPNVFAHPATLMQSAEQSANFRGGREAVYGYVPFHVAAQIPLLLLACCAIGVVTTLGFVRRNWRTETSQATRLCLVGVQLVALPLLAIARHSDLYNGLRQLLFASPAWAVMVTLGLARVFAWARERGRVRVAAGLAILALAAPIADQAQLFPYQYTYFNLALDATGVHVPTDYWRTSVPELLAKLPTDGQIICSPTRWGEDEADTTAGRFSADNSLDCRTDPLGPLASMWAAKKLPLGETLPHQEFYGIFDRDHLLPANCTRLAAVTRDRHGRTPSMTYVARCHQDAPALGSSPVSFELGAGEPYMAPERWAYAPEGWVQRSTTTALDAEGVSASLSFATPSRCAREACALVLDADAPADLVAAVDGTRATVTRVAGSVVVRIQPGASDAWVTFTRASGDPLGMRVRSLHVIPAES